MTAKATISIRAEVVGLGRKLLGYLTHTDDTTPTEAGMQYKVVGAADTAEALPLGGVATVQGVWIRAIDYDLEVDCDYSSSFNKDFLLKAGDVPAFIPNPVLMYVKSEESDETPAYEFLVYGT